jgi:TetR/AcrR family transcriptional regulator, regulator of mycofactocin system
MGRRERKKQQTHAALQEAALELFAKKGFRETRVSDITEAADVSEATFFRYFSSKEDVVLVGLMNPMDAVLDALAARPDDEKPLAACLAVMETPDALGLVPGKTEIAAIQLLAQSRTLTGQFFWRMTQVSGRLVKEFARRLDTSEGDLEPQLLASSVIGALSAVLQAWLANPTTTNPFQMTREAFLSLARGLEPGTKG